MHPATKPTALIFDFDGTLVDTLMILLDILYELAHNAPLPPEDISRIRAMTLFQVLRQLEVAPLRALLLWRGAYRALESKVNDITLVPGAAEMLKRLAKEYTVYILSSNRASNVTGVLDRFGLTQYIKIVRGNANPLDKTRALRRMARKHGLQAATTWYIGDQPGDIMAAHRSGMQAVAVTWGFSNLQVLEVMHPELLAFTPEEITDYFNMESDNGY